jgi:hypothetical protein
MVPDVRRQLLEHIPGRGPVRARILEATSVRVDQSSKELSRPAVGEPLLPLGENNRAVVLLPDAILGEEAGQCSQYEYTSTQFLGRNWLPTTPLRALCIAVIPLPRMRGTWCPARFEASGRPWAPRDTAIPRRRGRADKRSSPAAPRLGDPPDSRRHDSALAGGYRSSGPVPDRRPRKRELCGDLRRARSRLCEGQCGVHFGRGVHLAPPIRCGGEDSNLHARKGTAT